MGLNTYEGQDCTMDRTPHWHFMLSEWVQRPQVALRQCSAVVIFHDPERGVLEAFTLAVGEPGPNP